MPQSVNRPQEVGVAAPEGLAHGRIGDEHPGVLEVIRRAIDIRLVPTVLLCQLDDAVLDEQVEHRRADVVSAAAEMS